MNIQPFQKLATRQRSQKGGPIGLSTHQQGQLDMYTHNLNRVHPLIQSIDADLLAHAALRCRSYARALLTFERRIFEIRSKGEEENLQLYFEHLHEIYANLDEPDGMEGVSTQIIAPSLEHQIREHESTGRWTAAQSCWEVELQKKPDDLNLHAGLLRCLRNLGHYGKCQCVNSTYLTLSRYTRYTYSWCSQQPSGMETTTGQLPNRRCMDCRRLADSARECLEWPCKAFT